MHNIKIVKIFDVLYDRLKMEFNTGTISVVGSVLNHITGFNTKIGNTGDVDLILNSQEAEIALIKAVKIFGNNVNITYRPYLHRSLIIRFENNLIETFRYDPKIVGNLTEIKYKSKSYVLYKESMKNQLNAQFYTTCATYDRIISNICLYEKTQNINNFRNIKMDAKRIIKQFETIDMHINRADFNIENLNNYMRYKKTKIEHSILDLSLFI